MNLQEIEKLLDKYFEGETSLSEEKVLRDFFASGHVPDRWKNLEAYFGFLMQEREEQISDPEFDAKVMAAVRDNTMTRLFDLRRPWIYWISGVAAGILILLAIFVRFDPFSKRIEDTYKDPQVAYAEAKKILLYVSDKFNLGTSNLAPVTALETGLNRLKPVAAYDKGIGEVSRLDQVEKVENMIINN